MTNDMELVERFQHEMDALVRTAERSPYHTDGSRETARAMRDAAVSSLRALSADFTRASASQIEALRGEVEKLRGALIAMGRQIPGVGLHDSVSTDFLMLLPEEMRAWKTALKADGGGDV